MNKREETNILIDNMAKLANANLISAENAINQSVLLDIAKSLAIIADATDFIASEMEKKLE